MTCASKMKPTIYVGTAVISYLIARPSRSANAQRQRPPLLPRLSVAVCFEFVIMLSDQRADKQVAPTFT